MHLNPDISNLQDQDDRVEELTDGDQELLQVLQDRMQDANDWSDYHKILKALTQAAINGAQKLESADTATESVPQTMNNEHNACDLQKLHDRLDQIYDLFNHNTLNTEMLPHQIEATNQALASKVQQGSRNKNDIVTDWLMFKCGCYFGMAIECFMSSIGGARVRPYGWYWRLFELLRLIALVVALTKFVFR